MIERGHLSKVWDADGKEYIDCVAGIAVCSTGHCHPEVTRAICEQARETDPLLQPFYYVPGQAELLPGNWWRLPECTRYSSPNPCAEANDGAISFARLATGRKNFCCIYLHGVPWTHPVLPLSRISLRSGSRSPARTVPRSWTAITPTRSKRP